MNIIVDEKKIEKNNKIEPWEQDAIDQSRMLCSNLNHKHIFNA